MVDVARDLKNKFIFFNFFFKEKYNLLNNNKKRVVQCKRKYNVNIVSSVMCSSCLFVCINSVSMSSVM